MNKTLIIIVVLSTGCANVKYEFQDVPDHLLHTDDKYATLEQPILPDNLKKGPFPAGRVIEETRFE
jgi:hypothetical protein